MNLGENIYRLRAEKNMSQGDLADALEVSRQSVSKWENNSATPELDKLIKMSQLFEVSLDELVGNSLENTEESAAQDPSTPAEPQIIYVEKQVLPKLNRNVIIGSVFLLSAFLYALLLNQNMTGLSESIILSLPVGLCGLLFLFTRYPQLYCGWVGTGTYWLHFLLLISHWEVQYSYLLIGIILVITMIFWTVRATNAKRVHIPFWLWIAGAFILLSLLILLCMNTIPIL